MGEGVGGEGKNIVAIVPAAGLSTRFGGPNKLLQTYGTSTVIGTVVQTLLGTGLQVLVVTGRDADEVAKAVTPARTIFNPNYKEGLGASIAAGVAALSPDTAAYLIVLGDMPSIPQAAIEAVLKEFRTPPSSRWLVRGEGGGEATLSSFPGQDISAAEPSQEMVIVAAAYPDDPTRPAHPILFGAAYRDELFALTGDQGARPILQRHAEKLRLVPVEGVLIDIDTPF